LWPKDGGRWFRWADRSRRQHGCSVAVDHWRELSGVFVHRRREHRLVVVIVSAGSADRTRGVVVGRLHRLGGVVGRLHRLGGGVVDLARRHGGGRVRIALTGVTGPIRDRTPTVALLVHPACTSGRRRFVRLLTRLVPRLIIRHGSIEPWRWVAPASDRSTPRHHGVALALGCPSPGESSVGFPEGCPIGPVPQCTWIGSFQCVWVSVAAGSVHITSPSLPSG